MSLPTLLFTGGGSSGHVTPNLAIIEALREKHPDWRLLYIGSKDGIEQRLVEAEGIPFYCVATGKLRRYFSWKTFLEPFKIALGVLQSCVLLLQHRPRVIFSKGGFVAFPVVVAAWLCRVKVIAHESDLTPGLANRLSYPFVSQVCLSFEESKRYFPKQEKLSYTGSPIRQSLLQGDATHGRQLCHFTEVKPILLVTGGGLGARGLNEVLRSALPSLLAEVQIIHLCGTGLVDEQFQSVDGYRQFEYVTTDYADLLAAADYIVSRAGANAIYELLALNKPHILVPLSAAASRGDQLDNAKFFETLGLSKVIYPEDFSAPVLISALAQLQAEADSIQAKLEAWSLPKAVDSVVDKLVLLAQ